MEYQHQPVLLKEVLDTFDSLPLKKEVIFVDGTLGLAGHSMEIVQMCSGQVEKLSMIGLDKDAEALKIAKHRIEQAGLAGLFTFVQNDFNNFCSIMQELKVEKVDGILLDLGVSSMQLDDKSRGFSFSDPEMSLDMRMDQNHPKSAYSVLNTYNQKELEEMFKAGEEWHFRKIAAAIVDARKIKTLKTVGDLLQILQKVLPKKHQKTHYATDAFRAIRLEVNNEISRLNQTIQEMVELLSPGARLAVITFHSLEDRIVKDTFRQIANPCTCPPQLPYCSCGLLPTAKILSKKPIAPSAEEIKLNPRARSAKLRVIEKL